MLSALAHAALSKTRDTLGQASLPVTRSTDGPASQIDGFGSRPPAIRHRMFHGYPVLLLRTLASMVTQSRLARSSQRRSIISASTLDGRDPLCMLPSGLVQRTLCLVDGLLPTFALLQPVGLFPHPLYLANREFGKRANNAAGPGYISTQPACRSELSVNPPQSTPIVAIFAFPAASAS